MKSYIKAFSIIFLAFIAAGFVSLTDAAAEQGSCILQATDDDVFIIIYDMNSDGSRGGQTWESDKETQLKKIWSTGIIHP